MKKISYNDIDPGIFGEQQLDPFMAYEESPNDNMISVHKQELYPFNEYDPNPTGPVQDETPNNMDKFENHQRNGQEFEEFKEQSKRKKRLKILRKMLKNNKDTVLQPTPFYSSVYGTPSDISGVLTSPLEYYSGSISAEPGAITNNPYNNTYQSMTDVASKINSNTIHISAYSCNNEENMPLHKISQVIDFDDFIDNHDKDEVVLYQDRPDEEDVIEMHQPKEVVEISFKLPALPGSDADMPLEVSTDEDLVVEDKPKSSKKDKNDLQEIEVDDPWKDPEPKNALKWVQERLQNLPRHTGKETTGIERTISVLNRINKAISRIIANDFNGEVDISKLESARKEIIDGINRLEDAKEALEGGYKRKKADEQNGSLVKEGQKATHVGGIIVTVPLLISSIARICINSTVSAGKDLEITAHKLIEQYKLNDREQLELIQVMSDMGFPIRRPRGLPLNESFDPKSVDNFDFMPNYPA